jgi:hypothetical protein
MSLRRIGFAEEELFSCAAWPDARLGVYAAIHGEVAVLRLSTGVRLDLSLIGAYVHQRGFPVLRESESFSVCSLIDFHALGRSRPHETAVFFGRAALGYASIYAGSIGVEYFNDSVLGFDAAGPAIGIAAREKIRASLSEAICRIPLVANEGDRMPVTVSIRDLDAPGVCPAFLIDSGSEYSSINHVFVRDHSKSARLQRHVKRAVRKATGIDVPLELPNGEVIPLNMRVEEPPEYSVDVGVDRLDRVLGIDFLRRWIPVFDFPGRELALFDY